MPLKFSNGVYTVLCYNSGAMLFKLYQAIIIMDEFRLDGDD
jgi:hypothetical protein